VQTDIPDARHLLFADAPWYAALNADSPGMWGAWRIAKSNEDAWWKHVLHVAAVFASEHNYLPAYRARFAGIPAAELTVDRAERDGRSSTDPIWDIANELIVARYLERVLKWQLEQREPAGRATRRGDWQFITRSGRSVFVEVKSLHEPESPTASTYSCPVYTSRIRSVLKAAYSQLPDDGRATLVVLVSKGDLLRIPFGIMHGDIFQSLFGQMQVTFQVMPYDPNSVRLAPSFHDMFVQGSKHRRLGLVAGMVISGMDEPGIRFYGVHNPFANEGCQIVDQDLASADRFFVDEHGYGNSRDGISVSQVWGCMS
jgi:hypothetical protein